MLWRWNGREAVSRLLGRYAGVVFCVAMGMCGGCAVNDVGLVRVGRYENEMGHVVELDAVGIHLITNRSDGGLTIGRSHRVYFFAKNVEAAGAGIGEAVDRSVMKAVAKDKAIKRMGELGEPMAWMSRSEGVMFRTGSGGVGLTVGARTHAEMRIAEKFEGVVVVYGEMDRPGGYRFYVKEIKP